jgi:Ser/Thr protein kinase RdoA (MazF antagonist)
MPLRPAIDTLLARHGLRAVDVKLVAQLDCEIHRIALARPHGRAGLAPDADLALRIYPAHRSNAAPIAAELRWLHAMAQAGLHVPQPLADEQGQTLHRWQPEQQLPARHAVLLSWLPGRLLDRGLRPVHLHRVGELVARMHRCAEGLVAAGLMPPGQATDGPDLAAWAHGARAADPRLPASTHAVIAAAARQLCAARAGLGLGPAQHGWVHGDLHLWNLLFHGQQAGAIDFSDAGFGLHAQDLASALQYLRHPWVGNHDHGAHLPAMQAELLDGYARWRPLPPGVEQQIDLCVAIRMINTVEWILDQWPRLDTRPWGPGFLARVAGALQAWAG